MKTRLTPRRALLASLGLSVAACTEEVAPEPGHTSETAQLRVREHLGGLAVNLQTVQGGWTVQQVLGRAGAEPAREGDPQFREDVDALADWLGEQVLAPENVESQEGSDLIYKLDPHRFCDGDEDCHELLTRVPIRVRASGDLDLELLIGEPRHNPFDLELREDSLAAAVDLGALRASVLLIAEEMDAEGVELPEASGGLRAEINAPAVGERTLRFAVTEALRIAGQVDGEPVRIELAQSEAIVSFKQVGEIVDAALALNIGAFRVEGPISPASEESCFIDDESGETICDGDGEAAGPTGHIEAFLAGLTGEIRIDAAREALILTGIGLGDAQSFVKVDGSTVFAIDLNAEAGRRVDAEVERDGDRAVLTVTPGLDLALTFATDALAPYVEDLAEWTRDETIRLTLDGAEKPRVSATEDDKLEVLEGRLTLISRAGGTVVAEAGMCVEDRLVSDDDQAHPFEGLEAFACN